MRTTSMEPVRRGWLAMAVLSVLSGAPFAVQGATLGFDGAPASVEIGDTFSVAVLVNGLDPEIVSAFDLDVVFDPALLEATDVVFGSSLGGSADSASGFVLAPGRIDLFELSFLFDEPLAARQGQSVPLATLEFTARGLGVATLAFDAETQPGIDVKGLEALRLQFETVGTAAVRIDERTAQVTEPGTLGLGVLGLLAMALGLRRRAA
jgi:hypothetical protein